MYYPFDIFASLLFHSGWLYILHPNTLLAYSISIEQISEFFEHFISPPNSILMPEPLSGQDRIPRCPSCNTILSTFNTRFNNGCICCCCDPSNPLPYKE